MGVDEILIKYREGRSTSRLCFATLAHGKGVGDEREIKSPLSTRSWRWVAAGSGEPLKSLLQAGLQNEGSAMTREAAVSRELVL